MRKKAIRKLIFIKQKGYKPYNKKTKLFIFNKYSRNQKKRFLKIFIIFFILSLISILIFNIIKGNIFKKNNIPSIDSSYETNLDSHLYSRRKTLDRGLPFIKNCREGKLLNNSSLFKYTPNPKISAIVPVYNCEKTLKAAIRSIQNQDMLDIEIILINDNSNLKTVELLEELKKEDPRIKVINNEKRKGQFYARNIGALECKGEYIVNLDSDDMYVDIDVFSTLYYSIKQGDFDILAHKIFEAYSFTERHYIREHMFNGRKHNMEIYQPRLSCYAISTNGHRAVNDLNIWGKLYKSSVYKSAVNTLGKERYSYFAVYIEDYLMLHLLCNIASSFKFIKKYGLFHKVSSSSSSNHITKDQRLFGELFFFDIIFDFRKPECKLVSVKKFTDSCGGYKRANEENKKYYIKLYKKIMAAKDIEDEYKIIIRNRLANYTPFNTSEFKMN